MNERKEKIIEPLAMMEAALALLDAAGERGPAALLRQAIDELQAIPDSA